MARKAAEGKPSADPTSEGGGNTFNFLNEDLIKLKAKWLTRPPKGNLALTQGAKAVGVTLWIV
jgi:hypothetical protein